MAGGAPLRFEDEPNNPFVDYNYSVISETIPTHAGESKPTLKSKLIFMDYRFKNMSRNTLCISKVGLPKKPGNPNRQTDLHLWQERMPCE